MPRRRKIYTQEVVHVDHQTGEQIRSTTKKQYTENTDGVFVKNYMNGNESNLLDRLPPRLTDMARRLSYLLDDDGFIYLNKALKQKMCASMGIGDQTFRIYLMELSRSDIIKVCGGGKYMMNPYVYSKGLPPKVLENREVYNSL